MAEIGVVGFHGQSVLHRAPQPGRIGATRQLGDGALMSRLLGTKVAYDFRSADVRASNDVRSGSRERPTGNRDTRNQRPSAPTNLTLHQAVDIDVPIGCGDVPVWPGDVVVGDGEGVVVIPAAIADEVADEAIEMTAYEDFVTEKVQEGRSILGLYPPTEEQSRLDFAAWRKANGR